MTAWITAPATRRIEGRSVLVVVGRAGVARIEGESAPFAAAALDRLERRATAEELAAHLGELAGAEVPRALVDELVARLADVGAIAPAPSASAAASAAGARGLAGVRVLCAVSGAIAAAQAPWLVEALQGRGAIVRAALTRSASRFVRARALEALTHERVPVSLWRGEPDRPAPHIELARWADVVLVAPCSATTLGRLAGGLFSDVVAASALATRAPVVIAPSMNEAMLGAPSVQQNLAAVLDHGMYVLGGARGVEVADAPAARRLVGGAMPAPPEVARALEALWGAVGGGARAVDWDAGWRARPDEGHPWELDGLGDELRDVLARLAPPPRALCDLGCGLGAQAVEAARLGYRVIAVDASTAALARAADRPGAQEVIFVQADVGGDGLRGSFDVVLDRGTIHALPPATRAAALARAQALVRPGGLLVTVHDGLAADPRAGTARRAPEALAAELEGLELVDASPTTLRRGEEGAAWLTALRRPPPRAAP